MGCLLGYVLRIMQAGISCKWTNDSQRFLLEHLDTIHDSPSQIYHSALPFSPTSTWLQKCYCSELSQEIEVIAGLPDGWGVCSRTVFLGTQAFEVSCWNSTAAIGSVYSDIIILDAITGTQKASLSGHTDEVNSVIFSSDGRSLVSGSDDMTVKLWDMQTGGTIKTFFGHTKLVRSVSISADSAIIASGSFDMTILLWDTQTGECHCTIEQENQVYSVRFSPTNSQHLLSRSNYKIWQWDIYGHQTGPTFVGYRAIYSPDGTHLLSCHDGFVTIQNSSSGTIVARFPGVGNNLKHCCFSPDGRLIAVSAGSIIYVWNITGSMPHLIETFIGHTKDITSLTFSSSSSLVSTSQDQSVKFWQVGAQSATLDGAIPGPIPLVSSTIMSITLQTKDNIFITSDSDGVVRTCDIFTGLCKESFQTPAKGVNKRDIQLIDDRLILVWHTDQRIKIWDIKKKELLLTTNTPKGLEDIKISEDGSTVFSLGARVIQAQSMQTGEILGQAEIRYLQHNVGSLTINGTRVWVHYPAAESQVWDFGTLDSSPTQLPNMTLEVPHPAGVALWDTSLSCLKEGVTGKVVFWLSKRFGKPADVQWHGQYLVASFISGGVLVLDFSHVLP